MLHIYFSIFDLRKLNRVHKRLILMIHQVWDLLTVQVREVGGIALILSQMRIDDDNPCIHFVY